jgi:hypothetical protein
LIVGQFVQQAGGVAVADEQVGVGGGHEPLEKGRQRECK